MSAVPTLPTSLSPFADVRNKSASFLEKTGLPSSAEETWRKIRVDRRADVHFFSGRRLTGRIDNQALPKGTRLLSFEQASREPRLKKILEKHFQTALNEAKDYFALQNLAEWSRGILVDIEESASFPIVLSHSHYGEKNSGVIHRVIFCIRENVRAVIIEKFYSRQNAENYNTVQDSKVQDSKVQDSKVQDSKVQDSKVQDSKVQDSKVQSSQAKGSIERERPYWNTVTTAYTERNASLHYLSLRNYTDDDCHFQRFFSEQERDSRVFYGLAHCGGSFGKGFLRARLLGANAEFQGTGLYVGTGKEFHDMEMLMEHRCEHSRSALLYKTAVCERAHSVFDGQLLIPPGIKDVDSRQMNRNILLDSQARAESMPRLIIQSESISCEHGATVGMLDPEVLFYLVSRGLSEEEARSLIIEGFLEESLSQFCLEKEEYLQLLCNLQQRLGST